MRVVIAPDKFAGTLSATAAAAAIAAGWRPSRPTTTRAAAPVRRRTRAPRRRRQRPRRPSAARRRRPTRWAVPVPAEILVAWRHGIRRERPGGRAAPAGAGGTRSGARDVGRARRRCCEAALDAGAGGASSLGLGGSATNDGGRGMIEALGRSRAARTAPARLRRADRRPLTDVDNPLLGLNGATAVFGPQKGADARPCSGSRGGCAEWADLDGLARSPPPGAGAAGGLGAALFWLGAAARTGRGLVAEVDRAAGRARRAPTWS